jgi:hypothetical protein
MGEVRTEVKLVNIGDAVKARDGFIPESAVRWLTVNAVVDTGARTGTCGPLVINEKTREKLLTNIVRRSFMEKSINVIAIAVCFAVSCAAAGTCCLSPTAR